MLICPLIQRTHCTPYTALTTHYMMSYSSTSMVPIVGHVSASKNGKATGKFVYSLLTAASYNNNLTAINDTAAVLSTAAHVCVHSHT